jgi:hypothetical protein
LNLDNPTANDLAHAFRNVISQSAGQGQVDGRNAAGAVFVAQARAQVHALDQVGDLLLFN